MSGGEDGLDLGVPSPVSPSGFGSVEESGVDGSGVPVSGLPSPPGLSGFVAQGHFGAGSASGLGSLGGLPPLPCPPGVTIGQDFGSPSPESGFDSDGLGSMVVSGVPELGFVHASQSDESGSGFPLVESGLPASGVGSPPPGFASPPSCLGSLEGSGFPSPSPGPIGFAEHEPSPPASGLGSEEESGFESGVESGLPEFGLGSEGESSGLVSTGDSGSGSFSGAPPALGSLGSVVDGSGAGEEGVGCCAVEGLDVGEEPFEPGSVVEGLELAESVVGVGAGQELDPPPSVCTGVVVGSGVGSPVGVDAVEGAGGLESDSVGVGSAGG